MPDNAYHSEAIYEENIDGKSLIVKKYKTEDSQKEISIYKNILQHDQSLLAPEYHSSSEKENILRILKYDQVQEITPEIIDDIEDWLVNKYNKYKNNQEILDFGIRIKRYNRPRFEYLNRVFPNSVIKDISENQNMIVESIVRISKLPFTLEQGDLHLDNLLRDKDGNLIICDWVLANASNGLVDALKFLEIVEETDPDSLVDRIKSLEKELDIKNIQKITVQEGIIHYLSHLEYFSVYYKTGSDFKVCGQDVDKYIENCLKKLERLWINHTHSLIVEHI